MIKDMASGIPKNGINKGWIKEGEHLSLKTEFKKGQKPMYPFKKGQISWNKKDKIVKECLFCGKEFEVIPSRKDIAKYCSVGCHWASLKGTKRSKKIRDKISNTCKGKKLSEITIKNMSKASFERWQDQEYRDKFSKENHFNWKGGKSFEPYGLKFNNELKEQIRKRDNYICQECGYTEIQLGYKLSIHHIDYNKRNSDPNNLISLCISCHTQTNYNREDWTKYFKEKTWQN